MYIGNTKGWPLPVSLYLFHPLYLLMYYQLRDMQLCVLWSPSPITTQPIEGNGKSISEVVIQTQGGLPVWHSWPWLTSCFSSAIPDMDGQMYTLWHFVSLIKDKIELFRQIEGKFKRFSVAWKRGILFVICGLSVCEICLSLKNNSQCPVEFQVLQSKCFTFQLF